MGGSFDQAMYIGHADEILGVDHTEVAAVTYVDPSIYRQRNLVAIVGEYEEFFRVDLDWIHRHVGKRLRRDGDDISLPVIELYVREQICVAIILVFVHFVIERSVPDWLFVDEECVAFHPHDVALDSTTLKNRSSFSSGGRHSDDLAAFGPAAFETHSDRAVRCLQVQSVGYMLAVSTGSNSQRLLSRTGPKSDGRGIRQ